MTRLYRQRRRRRAVTEPGARTRAIDPNAIERSALYLSLAEIVEPETRHRRATIDTLTSPTQKEPSC